MTHREDPGAKRIELKQQGDFFDYAELSGFAKAYTEQYYSSSRPVTDDERALTEFFLPFLNKRAPGGSFLDPAAGPTVHHQLLVAPYFDQLDTGDYMEDNIEAVKKWHRAAEDAKSWDTYTSYYLAARGQAYDQIAVQQHESETRKKMREPVFSNLMNNPIVNTGKSYDAVGCFYCLEEVARNEDGFRKAVANASSMLKPGGALLVASLWNSNFYHLKDASGQTQIIDAFAVTQELLRDALEQAGLSIPPGGLRLIETSAQADEGVSGTLCAYALKRAN